MKFKIGEIAVCRSTNIAGIVKKIEGDKLTIQFARSRSMTRSVKKFRPLQEQA